MPIVELLEQPTDRLAAFNETGIRMLAWPLGLDEADWCAVPRSASAPPAPSG